MEPATYEVRLSNLAERNLKQIPEPVRRRVFGLLAYLRTDPYPRGIEKLTGRDRTYRLRFGKYRVIWHVEEAGRLVRVINIDKRPRVYG